jgi:hypothetical protein
MNVLVNYIIVDCSGLSTKKSPTVGHTGSNACGDMSSH